MNNQEQQEEEWRTTAYYPGYTFSNKGRVYSYKRNQYLRASENSKGYVQINVKDCNNVWKKPFLSRIIYLLYGDEPELLPYREVDHINGREKSNNNITNLRLATKQENEANKGKKKVNYQGNIPSSKYIGLNWEDSREKWKCQIFVGKSFSLGRFKHAENAVWVYNQVAETFKPPNHWLNTFPDNFELPEEDENREAVIAQKIAKINHWLNS